MKIAVPRFGERVAPCFEYSATIAIFVIHRKKIVDQIDFVLQSTRALDRIRLLKDQEVDVLICGGIENRFEDVVKANDIRVISWVVGDVETLVDEFLAGRLVAGSGRFHDDGAVPPDSSENENGSQE